MNFGTAVRLTVIVSAGASLYAQPRIEQVQNNYSYLLPGSPGYGIAQGSIFIIKGANLSSTSTGLQNVPLRTNLNGVTSRVTVNGVSTDVIWYYVTPNQLGGILPSRTPVGTGTITVTNPAGTSAPAAIQVVQSAFGVLTLDGSGSGAAAVFDVNFAFLSAQSSAKPGDVIQLFGTGAGPSIGDETVQQAQVNLAAVPIAVEVGGVAAAVAYHGRTIFPGLDQINVVIPPGVTAGCAVPISVRSGAFPSNAVTIPISTAGGACPASPAPTGSTEISQSEIDAIVASGQFRTGSVGLTRQSSYSISDSVTMGGTTTTLTRSDVLSAGFNRVSGADLPKLLNSQIAAPVAGRCDVFQGSLVNPFPNLIYKSLDAGTPLTVSGPAGTRSAARSINSVGQIGYAATVGTGAPGNYLDPGRYSFIGPGGPDVGSFSGSIDIAPELIWTNRASLAVVDRTRPITLAWSGGEPSTLVTIQGSSTLIQGSAVSVSSFQCYAKNTDGQFTVPASVLAQLPASGRITAGTFSLLQRGTLAIASVGTGTRMTAAGIDYLTAGNQWGVAQSAEYK